MVGYWPSSFFAFLWTETKSKESQLTEKDLILARTGLFSITETQIEKKVSLSKV